MEITTYFAPGTYAFDESAQGTLGYGVKGFFYGGTFPSLEGIDIAIVGVPESRNSVNNTKCDQAPDILREHFYNLFCGDFKPKLADLGNIVLGHTPADTYAALTDVICFLMELHVLPVVLGGSQDLTYACYQAYARRKQIIQMVTVDSSLDLGDPELPISSKSFLGQMVVSHPNYLFSFANAGYQTYKVDQNAIQLMEKLNFEAYRLGFLRQSIALIEPVIRSADLLSVDMSAVRKSDAPASPDVLPTGLFGEEICQIMRYAGLSEKMSCVGLYEYNPSLDVDGQTGQLMSIMLWCFVEGYYQRKHEHPHRDKDKWVKYTVVIEESDETLVFYRSKVTDRWWLEIPCDNEMQKRYQTHYMLPCSYEDYECAMRNELPERWMLAIRRFR